jgi:hypothetical protein
MNLLFFERFLETFGAMDTPAHIQEVGRNSQNVILSN